MEDYPLYPTGVQMAFSRADPAETFTQTSLWIRALRDVGALGCSSKAGFCRPLLQTPLWSWCKCLWRQMGFRAPPSVFLRNKTQVRDNLSALINVIFLKLENTLRQPFLYFWIGQGCICDPGIWEGKTGWSGVHGHPWLHSKFEASLRYMRHDTV